MDKHSDSPEKAFQPRSVKLDQYDSVRHHVGQQIRSELEQLERRIEALRRKDAPHAVIMISTYERMIDRKKGFLRHWNMLGSANY